MLSLLDVAFKRRVVVKSLEEMSPVGAPAFARSLCSLSWKTRGSSSSAQGNRGFTSCSHTEPGPSREGVVQGSLGSSGDFQLFCGVSMLEIVLCVPCSCFCGASGGALCRLP